MSVSRIDEPVGFHTSYQSTRLIQIVGDDTFLVLDILASLEDFQHTVYCAAAALRSARSSDDGARGG